MRQNTTFHMHMFRSEWFDKPIVPDGPIKFLFQFAN